MSPSHSKLSSSIAFIQPRSFTQQSLKGFTVPTTAWQWLQRWSVLFAESITRGIQKTGQKNSAIAPQRTQVSHDGYVCVRVPMFEAEQFGQVRSCVGCLFSGASRSFPEAVGLA